MEGWMGGKAGLRIAYSNQKLVPISDVRFKIDRLYMELEAYV